MSHWHNCAPNDDPVFPLFKLEDQQQQKRHFLCSILLLVIFDTLYSQKWIITFSKFGAVFVAQLVERSLPTPEVCGSNPVIGKLLCGTLLTLLKGKNKDKEKEKVPGNDPLKKQISVLTNNVSNCSHLLIFQKQSAEVLLRSELQDQSPRGGIQMTWLVRNSHGTWNSQSECFISA